MFCDGRIGEVSQDGLAAGNSSARILIVDDEPVMLETYSRVLVRAGYCVSQAASGLHAIAALEAGTFDAILSDITMPGLNGLDMLRAVREHDLDVPVIMNTGDPSVETAAKAMEFGALRYLVKPVERAELMNAVHDAVRLGRLARLKREAATYLGMADGQPADRAGLVGHPSASLTPAGVRTIVVI